MSKVSIEIDDFVIESILSDKKDGRYKIKDGSSLDDYVQYAAVIGLVLITNPAATYLMISDDLQELLGGK